MLSLVIFDCDGVLVDSEPLAAKVMAGLATAFGCPMDEVSCIARFTGLTIPQIRQELERSVGRRLPVDFENRVQAADFAAFERELRPINCVPAALDTVDAMGLKKCVASSGSPEKMRFTLGLTGLLPRFEPHLFSAKMVARGKPAPDLFLLAARQMGVEPRACCVIEDSTAGIRGAVAAGMLALGFVGGGHCGAGWAETLAQAGAGAVFADMAEMPERLADLH